MADLGIKQLDNANEIRKQTGQLLGAIEELIALDKEYVSLGSTIPTDSFADITNAEFGTGVSSVTDLFTYLDGAGIYTNLYKLSDGSQR
jgi:hypothetical protein